MFVTALYYSQLVHDLSKYIIFCDVLPWLTGPQKIFRLERKKVLVFVLNFLAAFCMSQYHSFDNCFQIITWIFVMILLIISRISRFYNESLYLMAQPSLKKYVCNSVALWLTFSELLIRHFK